MTRTKSNRNRRTAALLTLAAAVALLLSAATSAKAEEEGELAPPVALVELFTSQGCYSCPPADKVLAEEFAVRDDVAALELHVDYWDDLVYGGSVWADPYSDRDYTRRQTDYNIKIRDTRTVYTPQAVIHGHKQAAGTQSSRIAAAVEESLQTAPATRFRFLSAESDSDSESERRVRLEGPIQPGAQLFYAEFWRERSTEVTAGENKGKRMVNTNVVTKLERLPSNRRDIRLPPIDLAAQGCVLWLQRGRAGPVLSAARCP